MADPDPSSRHEPARRGLMGLLQFFRKGQAEPDDFPGAEAETAATGELVSQARAFQELRVEDVMKPRADIVAVDRDCPFADVVARFVEAEHSRMPVFKETLDEPVGVVHVKDVFKLLARKTRKPKPEDQILQGRYHLVRPVLYVPPSMRAAELLTLMRARQTHMALVIDEFGGTDGLVTMEDLIEAVVGDIADEHDEAEVAGVVERPGGVFEADARAPLEDLETAMGRDLAPPDLDEEIDTVAGLVTALAGRVPQRGEVITHEGGFDFEIVDADPRRVKRVRVRPTASTPPAAA